MRGVLVVLETEFFIRFRAVLRPRSFTELLYACGFLCDATGCYFLQGNLIFLLNTCLWLLKVRGAFSQPPATKAITDAEKDTTDTVSLANKQ